MRLASGAAVTRAYFCASQSRIVSSKINDFCPLPRRGTLYYCGERNSIAQSVWIYICDRGREKKNSRAALSSYSFNIYSYEAPVGSATFQSAQRAHDDGSASPLDVMYIIVFSRSAKILIGAFYIHLSKTTAVGLPRFCMRCQYTRKISFACKK